VSSLILLWQEERTGTFKIVCFSFFIPCKMPIENKKGKHKNFKKKISGAVDHILAHVDWSYFKAHIVSFS
jgi:hypothetical protein